MEAVYVQPLGKDGVMVVGEEQERGRRQEEASTTDEETEEDSDPEPVPPARRRVSFADAFGLNLVSVKEFDNVDVTEPEVSEPAEGEATHPSEEFYMSCLFTVPSSPEDLDQRLQEQMVELESIELLPGTTMLRGIIRVVNLCYSKSVYARISLDRWNSHFDLLAEYLPGSSDRKTDRFTFRYTVVPPFEREGTRVEFCLRYETSAGTFWANNKEMNYVMFCHQKVHAKELGPPVQEESASQRGKRSCLKAKRRGCAEEKTREAFDPAAVAAEAEAPHKAAAADRKTQDRAEIQSLLYHEEHKPMVDSIKRQDRAPRLARTKDIFSQKGVQATEASLDDSADDQKIRHPMAVPRGNSASRLHEKKQCNTSSQVLTYHQIPLFTLDWNSSADDIWTRRTKLTPSKASRENTTEASLSVDDMWEAFLKGDPADKEISVCDAWQAFLDGPSCKDRPSVPESEWLQTAASVSPSKDKERQSPYAASSQDLRSPVGSGTPTPQSDTRETSPARVALNAEGHQQAEAGVSCPRGGNKAAQRASERSQTNSETDTLQEFSLMRAITVSEGSVDSPAECHKHAIREQGEGIIEGAEGIGDEPSDRHTAGVVTGSGESETTDMTAMPESQNASAVDRISQGVSMEEGLSYSSEAGVAGTTHNAVHETLAFWETIRQETKDGKGFVFSAARQGVEDGIIANSMENKVSTEEEIFRPRKTEGCEISRRYADEKRCEGFGLRQGPLKHDERDGYETRHSQSQSDEFNLNQTCKKNFGQSRIMAGNFKLNESETEDVASNNKHLDMQQEEVEMAYCASAKTEGLKEAEIIELLNEEAAKESCIQEEEQNTTLINPIGAQTSSSCGGIIQEKQEPRIEINPSARTAESRKMMKKATRHDHDTFKPFPTYECNPNRTAVLEMRWPHSQEDMKGQNEDIGGEMSPEEGTMTRGVSKRATSTGPQHQPETLERIKADMSQTDKDERASIRKLKIAAVGELMGNVKNPQGESKNAPAELKEQELSAEVESSPHVECKKLSEGTKDPTTAEKTAALKVIESGLDEVLVERFGEDLVRRIWAEVFHQRSNARASNRDINAGDGVGSRLTDAPDTKDCRRLSEKDFNAIFDSGALPLTELPSDPNLSLRQSQEETSATRSRDSATERGQRLTKTGLFSQAAPEPTRSRPKSQTDVNPGARLSEDLEPVSAARTGPPSSPPAHLLSSPKDEGHDTQMKERTFTHLDTGRQTEAQLSPPEKKFEESRGFVFWSVLYILVHVTRLLICGLLVGGFFVIVFLYDFPAFFVLYTFSLCWWFYKWMRHRVATNKRMAR